MSAPIQLTYLYDPLCGWCYGAGPAIKTLMQHDDITVAALPSGLFAGPGAFAMNAGFAAHAWAADQRIGQLTGQVFSPAYRENLLESTTGMVDSGPATLAVSAVHLTAPEQEFDALLAMQRENGLEAAAERFADPDAALLRFNNDRIQAAQAEMRRFGARGVPTLILGTGPKARVVDTNALYGRPEALIGALRAG